MTKKKILAVVLTLALLVTQFAMLGVSAETVALSGRGDFAKGVAIHRSNGYEAYQKPYDAILDAAALGANVIRTDSQSDGYDADFALVADKYGMDVLFVTSIDLTLSGKTSLTQDEYNEVYNKFYNKAKALKDYNAYIQIDNELDNIYYKGSGFLTDGTDASRYNSVVGVALAINAANKAVKDANAANGSNIKTIVNFSYNHYGFLEALKNVKIDASLLTTTTSADYVQADWDIIGLDYYSNMYDDYKYENILSEVKTKFNKNIIICEANLTPESKNANGTIEYAQNVDWLEEFVRDCYADSNVLGFVAYELYDEPAYSKNGWSAESHFGLIDKDGNKKDTYNLLTALYNGTGVVADRVVAQAPELDFADVEISKEGVSTTFPSTYSNTSNRLVINLTENPLDLSEVSAFEFDIYIEDYDAFKAAVSGKRINFALSNTDVKTKIRIRFDIENQITASGWNHIVLKTTDRWQVDSGFSYKEIKWAMIFFQDGENEYNPIAGSKIAFANICGIKEEIDRTPAWPEYDHIKVLGETNGKKDYWGSSANNNNFLISKLDPINMESTEQVEFDIYIEDYDAFVAATTDKNWHFRFGDANDYYLELDVRKNQITKSGWNHVTAGWMNSNNDAETDRVKISNENINLKAITWVKLFWVDAISLPVQARIANICFSTKEIHRIPAWPEYERVEILKNTDKNFWGSTANNSNFLIGKLGPFDMSQTEQVEFDIFINTYSTYMNGISGKDIFFRFGDKNDNYIDVKIDKSQITKSGWNHVVLVWLNKDVDADTDRYSITGNIDLEHITWIKFYCNGGVDWSTTRRTRMANICFTTKEINRLPEWTDAERVEVLKDSGINYWGKGANNGNFLKTGLGDNDITGTDQVEFDVYINDYDSFVQAISNKNLAFRFGHGDHYVDLYFDKAQITKTGWNHITSIWVDKNTDPNTDRVSATGNMNPKTITWVKLFWNWANGSGSDSAMSVQTRLANVCFTNSKANEEPTIQIPTEVMKDKIDFIGAELKTINFDNDGYSVGWYDLEEAIDISAENFMLEFDVLIEDSATSTFTVNLYDSEGKMAIYAFEGLVDGWNRFAVRISDCVNEGINFADVCSYDFESEARSSVIVSNLYVAEFVKGDGNRDGVVDVKDLIRIKNHTLGNANADGTIGNKVAMDVDGNDYVIGASDLTALKYNLLTNNWR